MAAETPVAGEVSLAQWNRTLLSRQHLLTRVDEDAVEVLDRCVGLQSQDPRAAFYGLWSRIDGFDPTELDDLMTDREVVRMALLRSTVFLMDAQDARWVRPLAQAAMEGEVRSNHLRRLVDATASDITAHARELLSGKELTAKALGQALGHRWPNDPPSTLTAVARCTLPLVQVPPRGLWNGHAGATYRLLDDWVGPGEPAVTGDEARKDLIRLYLRGFGPSTIKGIQTWAGMTRLRPLVEAMESDWELNRFRGPDGAELFDLDGIDIVDGDEPAPARLLAPFDHVVTAQADRRRIIDDDVYAKLSTPNGLMPGLGLVDGRVVARWSADDTGAVYVEPLAPVDAAGTRALQEEAQRLTEFHREHPAT